ncbi:MAG: hypothetical protein ACO1RT_17595 [Planctomycetaceae bacterium]
MLNWIRQRIWNKRRLIFRFNDGQAVRAVDPIEIAIALHEHKEYLPAHLHDAADGDKEAQRIVARAACDAFGVMAWNGFNEGLTVAERIELMMAFDAYLDTLKKNIAFSPILRTYTASTSKASGAPTTKPMSDCGSTGTDPCGERPMSSATESTPPKASYD